MSGNNNRRKAAIYGAACGALSPAPPAPNVARQVPFPRREGNAGGVQSFRKECARGPAGRGWPGGSRCSDGPRAAGAWFPGPGWLRSAQEPGPRRPDGLPGRRGPGRRRRSGGGRWGRERGRPESLFCRCQRGAAAGPAPPPGPRGVGVAEAGGPPPQVPRGRGGAGRNPRAPSVLYAHAPPPIS